MNAVATLANPPVSNPRAPHPRAPDPQAPDPRAPDPRAPEAESLEDQITELAAHISAATWRLLALIREYDLCSGWNGGGTRSCAHWLNWKCGIALGAAREKVRVAHALAELPQISEAFREGRLSYSKVRAMTRVATPQNEDYLLMIARHGTASHMERLVRSYRRVGRPEAAKQLSRRELSYYIDDDGSYVIRGRLTPEQGQRLLQALDAAAEELPRDDDDSAAMRRADALEAVAESFLNVGTGASACNSNGADRYTVHVHTRIDELAEAGDVSAETSRRQSCDCGVVHWLENERGHALDIGRRSRNITPAIRRALQHRDGGCTFPGCTAHRHVDAHHVVHWAGGGETKLDNLLLLCRHHHRLVHEGGFGVSLSASGEKCFRRPDGSVIPAVAETRFRGNVFALQKAHRVNQLELGPRSLVPHWKGEAMDLGMAVGGLLARDSGLSGRDGGLSGRDGGYRQK